jgi:phage gp29-like protein
MPLPQSRAAPPPRAAGRSTRRLVTALLLGASIAGCATTPLPPGTRVAADPDALADVIAQVPVVLLGEVHDKVRREIVMHDVRQLAPTITQQIVTPIALFNGMFAADRMPKFCYDTKETVDQQMMVGVLEKAVGLGLEIDVEWAYEALQIPKAGKGAKIIGTTATKQPADPAAAAAALTRLVALAKAKEGSGGSEVLPAYIAQLTALAAPHEQSMVQQIAAIVGESGDFDAAIEAIEALTINTRPTTLAQTIAQALSAANLAGRGED